MDETAARAQQEILRGRLVALGFDEVRFATLAELGGERLSAWIAAGQHADMQWMERTAEKRLKPALVLSEARSVIMLGVNYASDAAEAAPSKTGEKRATWARYALHEDYHDTIKVGLNAAGNVLEEMYGATREDYHGSGARARLGGEGRARFHRQKRDADFATARQLVVFGDDFDAAGISAGRAGAPAGD